MASGTATRRPALTIPASRPAWARANGRCLAVTLADTRCKDKPRKGHGTCQAHRYQEEQV